MVDPVFTRDELEDGGASAFPRARSGYAEILDEAHVMIRDTNDRIVFWNSGEERLYGWTKDEALKQVSHHLLQTKFPQPLTAIRAALERDGQWKGELSHRTRDGTPITVASHWVLHRDEQGKPRAILEVNNDITELKRSEQTSQHLNLALANAMPGFFKVDAMGRFVEINDHFAQMLGYMSSELLARDWRLTIHPEDQATALQAYEHLLDNGNAELEVRAIRKDGSVFDEHMLLVAVNDGRGMSAGYYGFTRDTTRRKREHRLRESRERLRAFAIHLDSAIESERIRISREIHDEIGQALMSLAIDLASLDDQVTDAARERTVTAVREKIGSMANVLGGMIADVRRIAGALCPPLYSESQFPLPALRAGPTGYLAKERAPNELLAVVKKILEGDMNISQESSRQITIELLDGTEKLPHERLSRRELQILLRIASGEALTVIAKESSLNPKTVSTYRSRILEKMGLKTNAHLTQYCTRHRLIQ